VSAIISLVEWRSDVIWVYIEAVLVTRYDSIVVGGFVSLLKLPLLVQSDC
jgi:hypothetical protein